MVVVVVAGRHSKEGIVEVVAFVVVVQQLFLRMDCVLGQIPFVAAGWVVNTAADNS